MVWLGIDYRVESGKKTPPFQEKRLQAENPEVDLSGLPAEISFCWNPEGKCWKYEYLRLAEMATRACGQKESAGVQGERGCVRVRRHEEEVGEEPDRRLCV